MTSRFPVVDVDKNECVFYKSHQIDQFQSYEIVWHGYNIRGCGLSFYAEGSNIFSVDDYKICVEPVVWNMPDCASQLYLKYNNVKVSTMLTYLLHFQLFHWISMKSTIGSWRPPGKLQNWLLLTNSRRRYMAEIMPIRRKTLSNQSISCEIPGNSHWIKVIHVSSQAIIFTLWKYQVFTSYCKVTSCKAVFLRLRFERNMTCSNTKVNV